MTYYGNQEILKHYKTAFFCSQKCPATVILKSYDWAIEQRTQGNCIITAAHSPIEKDVFLFLLKGTQPLILVTGKIAYLRIDSPIKKAVEDKRLLIITMGNTKRQFSKNSVFKRNLYIARLADEILVSYALPEGSITRLIDKISSAKTITFLQ